MGAFRRVENVRNESDEGSLEAEVLLNGMLAPDRLLDIVENFIVYDESKPGAARKVIARNHQVLGVNRAVASVSRQEALKREFTPNKRLSHRVVELPLGSRALEGVLTCAWHRRRGDVTVHTRRACQYCGSGHILISGDSVCFGTPRVAASPILWHSSLRRCGEGWKVISRFC